MFEYQFNCLVVVLTVFLPTISESIDQDFTNPVSSNAPLETFNLETLKNLAEATELEDKVQETATLSEEGTSAHSIIVSADISTTSQIETVTEKESGSETIGLTKDSTSEGLKIEQAFVKVPEPEKEEKPNLLNEQDQSKSIARESIDASKVVEKREADTIERGRENNSSLLQPNEETLSKSYPDNTQIAQSNFLTSNAVQPAGPIEDPDSARKFRDVYDENGNAHNVEEKLQPEQNSLFTNKNPSTIVVKAKNRCSVCEDRMQKVVPDGSSFIELGCDHEEDDTIRKFQDMLTLIDNIIESAGSNARKELGLCRKSKLADAACLLTNDDEKLEKTVLQIVSCVKDAMKDMSSKNCIPLPRELHSFLIWLMHGSEGGGMCPPTIQENKSKPSYLFHEDNHRPHIGGSIYGTPPCPSGSLIELISSNKAMPISQNKLAISVPLISPQNQEQSESVMSIQPQYDVENTQNNNVNNQYIGEEKSDTAYQRKLPFIGRNFYRPLRSVPNIKTTDDQDQINNQVNSPLEKDPLKELMSDLEGVQSFYSSDSNYEKQSSVIPQTQNCLNPEKNEKSITKRDISRKKTVGKKSRDNFSDNKNSQRKKKRRDGIVKSKKISRSSPLTSKLSESSDDFQDGLQQGLKVDKLICSRNRKDKKKEKKKLKSTNQKDLAGAEDSSNENKEVNDLNQDVKKDDSNLNSSDATKTSFEESSFSDEPLDSEQESIGSYSHKPPNKLKKKKRKNSKTNLNKDKKYKTTEATIRSGTINQTELPNSDLATQPTNKISKNQYQDTARFQVSFSNKVSKVSKLKPSVIFEDDLSADTTKQTEDDDYSETQYDLSDPDDYEPNYEDENDEADLYYDKNEKKESKSNKVSNSKDVKKKSRETSLKCKQSFSFNKKNRVVKKKKKNNSKTNDKNQCIREQYSATSKVESSQAKTTTPEFLSTLTSETRTNSDVESTTETAISTSSNADSRSYETSIDFHNNENEDSNKNKKESTENIIKNTFERKEFLPESAEQGTNKDETDETKKSDKGEKSDTLSDDNLGNYADSINKKTDARNNVIQESSKSIATSVKGKLYTKDTSRLQNQNSNRSSNKKKQDLKNKISKPVSKTRKQFEKPLLKITNNFKSKASSGLKKSHEVDDTDNIVSKVRNKVIIEDEDDTEDEGIQSDITDQDENDEDNDGELEDDDALDEVKPKTQMWVEDDRSILDPYSFSNLEVAPNSDINENNFLPKPVRMNNGINYHVITNKNPPFSKETFLRIISNPHSETHRRNFARERQESLFNVTELLKGVKLVNAAETKILNSSTTSNANVGATQEKDIQTEETVQDSSEKADFSDTTMVKLSTIVPKPIDGPDTPPTYRTTLIQSSSISSDLTQDKLSEETAKLDDKPTNLTNEREFPMKNDFRYLPLDRVSLRKPLEMLF